MNVIDADLHFFCEGFLLLVVVVVFVCLCVAGWKDGVC